MKNTLTPSGQQRSTALWSIAFKGGGKKIYEK
jgi:hypothetical protein